MRMIGLICAGVFGTLCIIFVTSLYIRPVQQLREAQANAQAQRCVVLSDHTDQDIVDCYTRVGLEIPEDLR